MGHKGTVKKGEFIFPKGLFCRTVGAGWGLNRAQKQGLPQLYFFREASASKASDEVIFSPGIKKKKKNLTQSPTSFHFCSAD